MLIEELEQEVKKGEANYIFADGDLSAFNAELNQPKQDMGIDLLSKDFEEDDNDLADVSVEQRNRMAKHSAKFLAHMTDTGAAFGLSLISLKNSSEHRADKESLDHLQSIIYEYCKETGGDIPLWAQLTICLISIYGLQIPGAIQSRREIKKLRDGRELTTGREIPTGVVEIKEQTTTTTESTSPDGTTGV